MLNKSKWVFPLVLASFALQGIAKDTPQPILKDRKFTGLVEKVSQHNREICDCVELSITLKTASERLEHGSGLRAISKNTTFSLSRGDMVEITGIQFREAGKMVVLANEVRRGGDTLSLRGKFGRPCVDTTARSHVSGVWKLITGVDPHD